MPVYMCNAAKGAVDASAKSKIAADITRIHCAATDAPPQFVHAFFLDDAPHQPLNGKTASVLGNIRAGRTDAQKTQIAADIQASIHQHTGVPLEEIAVAIFETPASWVLEGGEIMPEPGEEAEWLVQHEAKRAAAQKV